MYDLSENLSLGTSSQVWLCSDFDGYNQLRTVGYPAYLSAQRKAALERIRQARLLHDGRHKQLFVREGRTQFSFPVDNINGREAVVFSPYNLLKLITLKSADLLFGEQPAVKVDAEIQQRAVEALVKRTSLHHVLYAAAKDASVDGLAYLETVAENGQVYIKRRDGADIFPEGLIQANGQYKSYVQFNAKNTGSDESPKWMLLVTRYTAGRITRTLQAMDRYGNIRPAVLTLDQWPQEDAASDPIEPETLTGLDRPTILYVPNDLVRGIAVSDYDGLLDLQDSLNFKNSQLARVIAKHAIPRLAAHAMTADPDGNLRNAAEVFYYNTPDEIPRYITWNAELAAAMEDRKEVRSQLLTLSETSPILLGIREGSGTHNAYKSVRLEAMNSLTKAQRKGVIWKSALQQLLALALDLEQTNPYQLRYPRKDVGVEIRDGLPIDSDALATEVATYRGCGAMSQENAVEIRLKDPAAVSKELSALAREAAQQTPSIFLGGPTKDGQESTSEAGTENGLAADAADEATNAAVEIAA